MSVNSVVTVPSKRILVPKKNKQAANNCLAKMRTAPREFCLRRAAAMTLCRPLHPAWGISTKRCFQTVMKILVTFHPHDLMAIFITVLNIFPWMFNSEENVQNRWADTTPFQWWVLRHFNHFNLYGMHQCMQIKNSDSKYFFRSLHREKSFSF